ncbi:endonuclease III [Candidatus Gottesmanbacteria bacterium]|nr:endonuclease III [Candidatus Gottesmanbacteria bacterium]
MKNPSQDKILATLKKTYPDPKIALKYGSNWELLVSVILSAQCTDIKVNEVTGKLFAKYKTLESYVNADISQFEQNIRSTGFYHAKAKNILVTAKIVKEKFKGVVPKTMAGILTLPGVARKTANVVLGNAYKVVEGIAVDTHVHRISQRLRLVDLGKIGGKKKMTFKKGGKEVLDYVRDADPNKIEQELMKVIPKEDWFKYTYLIINHGRAICKAQNPNCSICPFKSLCPTSRVN